MVGDRRLQAVGRGACPHRIADRPDQSGATRAHEVSGECGIAGAQPVEIGLDLAHRLAGAGRVH